MSIIRKPLVGNPPFVDSGRISSLRREATSYAKDRVDTCAEAVADLSASAHRLVEHHTDQAVDRWLERIGAEYEFDDDLRCVDERAIEAFLRRYGLDEARLDDRTLEAIRNRVADSSESHSARQIGRTIADAVERPDLRGTRSEGEPIVELLSELRASLEEDGVESLDDVLERDAIETAKRIERALAEDVPQAIRAARSTDPNAGTETASPVAVALAAMTLLANGSETDPTTDATLAELAARLLQVSEGGFDGGPEHALDGTILDTLEKIRQGEADLDALRSRSAGSAALVALFVVNLVGMGIGAWLSYRHAPPIPDEIRDSKGDVVVTGERIRAGKKAFQANGLMNQGSILGNGAYFDVDYTADALRLKSRFMGEYYVEQRGADSAEALDDAERAAIEKRVRSELEAGDPESPIVEYSAAEAYAHRRIREEYVERYHEGDPERGIPAGFVETAKQAERVADFAIWTAWIAHTNRPGSDHSYTNDWPYDPAVGNRPTGQVLVWSTISVVLLIGGGGLGVWAYHALDFAEPTIETIDVPLPDDVSVTPAQYAAAWYVPVAGALFVVQAFAGALLAHYYIERTGFFGIPDALGIDIVSLLPFATARTWHVNLAILWITTLWLAGGLFLPGLFSDRDPPWQAAGTSALLGVLVATTVGAFAGVWLGTHGAFASPEEGELWWWLGSEGLEYLEVGRLWKLLLLAGFGGWAGLVLRSVRRMDDSPTGLGHFLVYAGGSIALLFAASMLYTPETNIAMTEFWRWWVVHMWVEGVFEFFVTAVVSVALVSMELLERGDAEKAILFEVFAIMAAGIAGVSHHYWWVGLPDFWVPMGTTFSTLEFVPLVFVLYRSLGEYRSLRAQDESFPYELPLLFILGSSVWNFVGGGVLGFFINLPVINYYEHGTYLTVAHAHAATFGAFGLLAMGLGTYILRVVTPEDAWDPSWFRGSFWLTNIGLAVMVVVSLLPIGFAQLKAVYTDGYAAARSLEFYERPKIQALLWARTLGDTPMILGALAFTVGAVRHLYAARRERRRSPVGPSSTASSMG